MLSPRFLTLLAFFTLTAPPGQAQGTTPAAVFAPPFQDLAAAIEAADYLPWLREGTRVSFRTTSSLPDPNGRELASATKSLTQLDVVAVAGGQVVASANTWTELQGAQFGVVGGWMPAQQSAHIAHAGYGEYWVHPEVLAQAVALHADGSRSWRASRGTQRVAGKTYQVVTLNAADDRRQHSYVYDVETGVLLTLMFSQRARTNLPFLPTLSLEYAGTRQRDLPWREGRPPAWIFSTQRFVYEGMSVTGYQDGSTEQRTAELRFDVDSRGPNHLLGTSQSKLDGKLIEDPSQRVSGASSTSGLWLPPLALKELAGRYQRKPIRIDRDPLTRAELSLTFAGRAPYGRQVVTLTEQTPVVTIMSDYELETGALLATVTRIDSIALSIQLQLSEVE